MGDNELLDVMRAEHDAIFNADHAPDTIKESLKLYVDHGTPTSDFLYACLTNDLFGAVKRADAQHGNKLCAIVSYIYNRIPAQAQGSREKVERWMDHTGMEGYRDLG